jgi:hypothetical protein
MKLEAIIRGEENYEERKGEVEWSGKGAFQWRLGRQCPGKSILEKKEEQQVHKALLVPGAARSAP